MPPPMGSELGRVTREVQLGLQMNEALARMVRRNDSEDLRLMLIAVQIQSQVGGNLAHILDTIEFTVRERVRIKGEIRSLTVQARASGWVLICLPFGMTGILMGIAPSYFDPMLHKTAGLILLGVAGFMMACGYGIIRRIVNIKV
jgi:tight adherence protein B